MRATIQLCTYNRAAILERVLDACFEQTAGTDQYEVVLVNDGSTDETANVIARAEKRATCRFTVLTQPNSGLAKGRNTGIAHACGERIIFIDDDVLVLPNFVEEHLRSHVRYPLAIVRGAAINVEDLDDLPPPVWSISHYSGNYFWTTNVSVPLRTIRAIGGFNESFAEYGWEDIDVGLRLRFAGVKAVFNRHALAYHYKPRPTAGQLERMVQQARAQARTAVQLERLHPHWRTYLATGDTLVQRVFHRWQRTNAARHSRALAALSPDEQLSRQQLRAARAVAADAYFDELERAHTSFTHR